MSNFHYFHPSDQVEANAVVTTGGTEDTAYPLTNVTDFGYANLPNPGKLTVFTGDFIFDFGSAQRVDAALVWHNFDASLACVWQANASNSWATPSLTRTLTPPAKRANDYTIKIYTDFRTGPAGYTTSGYRYWRLNVSGTNSAALGVKVMLFSRVRTMDKNYKWSYAIETSAMSIDMSTDALVPWAYDLRSAPGLFKADIIPTDADVTRFEDWMLACGGRATLCGFVRNPSTNQGSIVRWASVSSGPVSPGIVAQRFSSAHVAPNFNPSQIMLEEVTAGDPEWY